MPLIAQAAGDQGQREVAVALLPGGEIGIGNKPRAAIGGGEYPVGVETCRTRRCAGREGPLLGPEAVDQLMADAGQVQIPSTGQLLVLVEQLRGRFEREQAGLPRTQVFLQALCKIHGDGPVGARFTRCNNGAANVGNPPFRIGHRTFLFTPAGGG
ncbi:hypothetical protein D3C73_940170 [compost metagenome]